MNMLHEMQRGDRNATFADTYLTAFKGDSEVAVYVYEFPNDDEVCVKYLNTHEQETIDCDNLNFRSSDLGMFRDENRLVYLARRPERQWRRGTRHSVCRAYVLYDGGEVRRVEIRGDLGTAWFECAMEHFLLNQPLQKDVINRDLAFAGNTLFFRTVPIGERISGNEIKIYNFLQEVELPKIEGYKYVAATSS